MSVDYTTTEASDATPLDVAEVSLQPEGRQPVRSLDKRRASDLFEFMKQVLDGYRGESLWSNWHRRQALTSLSYEGAEDPGSEPRAIHQTFRMSAADLAMLDWMCGKRGETRGETLRRLIEAAFCQLNRLPGDLPGERQIVGWRKVGKDEFVAVLEGEEELPVPVARQG